MPSFGRLLLASVALFAAQPALAQDIVVTGKPLKDTAAGLAECIKRGCPPNEDMAATIVHAENQFVSGDYEGARKTLHSSLGRNRKHAKEYPVELSNVLRANGRVAEHLGEAKDFQLSTLDMRDTLKDGFGENDFRTLVAQVEVGDSRAKLGYPDEAERIYRDVEKRALEAKQFRIASFARLRLSLLAQARFEDDPNSRNAAALDSRLAGLIDSPLADSGDFVMAAKVLRARKDRRTGSTASTDELVRTFASAGGVSRPVLLFAEPVGQIDPFAGRADGVNGQAPAWTRWSNNRYGQWVDVGFWIGQDGKVSDVEVLRQQGSTQWAKPVMRSISRRVYAPLRQNGDSTPGFYMVERYTLTARVAQGEETGTRLRIREARPRIEMLELTPDAGEEKLAKEEKVAKAD
ncbi:MAG: energy transducer TonB [Novosphingobium sp.]|nr:energy transducer TonB [Novosphingobium sp.]